MVAPPRIDPGSGPRKATGARRILPGFGALRILCLIGFVASCSGNESPDRREARPAGTSGVSAEGAGTWSDLAAPSRPFDLILITLDTTRRDRISCYGEMSGTTPSLDRFASESLVFENAQSPVPVTLPAHSSILTGLWPFEHGVRNNGTFVLPESLTTLAELLRGKGYETGAVLGAFPLEQRFGTGQGFDLYDDRFPAVSRERAEETARRAGEEVTRLALDWLQGRGGRPFFLWAHYYDPHHPYRPPEPFRQRWPDDPYTAAVASMDHAIGRLLEGALEAGRLERAVVVIAGDHGEGLGDHVELTHTVFVYGETQHVPFLLRLPEDPPFSGPQWRGRRVPGLVSLVDILPTAWNALGFAPTELPRHSGRSLLPVVTGAPAREWVYHESLIPRLEHWATELRALQTERWKYIRAPRPELYDLANDPRERANLAERERGRVREMERDLAALLAGREKSTEVALDQETLERLRSLGYIAGGLSSAGPAPTADPKDMIWVPMTVTRAQELADLSRVAEALAAVDSVLARHPETILARELRALYLTRLGRTAEAIAAYQKALADCGDCPSKLKLLQGYSFALLGAGRADEARRQAQALVRAYPREPWLHLLLAEALLATGDPDGARTAILEERKLSPHDPRPLATLAHIERASGRPAEAERALRDALALRPGEADLQLELASLLSDTGRERQATELLDALLAAHPRHPGGHALRASIYSRSGRHAEAARAYQAALAAQPGDLRYLHGLGNSYLELNRLSAADSCFQEAIRSGRATQGILASVGILRARQGRRDEAIRQWEDAIRLDPNSRMVPMLHKQIDAARAGRAGTGG